MGVFPFLVFLFLLHSHFRYPVCQGPDRLYPHNPCMESFLGSFASTYKIALHNVHKVWRVPTYNTLKAERDRRQTNFGNSNSTRMSAKFQYSQKLKPKGAYVMPSRNAGDKLARLRNKERALWGSWFPKPKALSCLDRLLARP